MAVPKRKSSAARRDKRRANWKLVAPNVIKCTKCGELVMPHRACRACGTYKGKVVIEVK
ncbi:MAG: 50S ribosomal protein L32 [Vallitaleaceae bacterium]|nr:50S ribosomal protein L32 [Vallitaleaceae bacterium]